jgi:ubiquinone/menaquinone biosynthesis C-methylase UbiE
MREQDAKMLPGFSMHRQVISANIEFYKQIASKYDRYESCAVDSFFQASVEEDLTTVDRAFAQRGAPVHCLDCGGGTGNVTLKILRRGWQVTVVDVSADMLEILERKVHAAGYSATFLNEPIESFFARSAETFDLLSFSSVLHHLYSPLDTIRAAAERIATQGFFYSVFDPVPPSSPLAAGCFTTLDTVVAKVLHDRADFIPGLVRRVRKLAAPRDLTHARAVVSPGDLAEYHARQGLNDQAIENALLQAGFTVDRRRYPVGRTAPMRFANRHLRLVLNFKILAQRTGSTSQ